MLSWVRDDLVGPPVDAIVAAACGRRLDEGSLMPGSGTRLHAFLPPVAVRGPYLSLRSFQPKPFDRHELVACGTVPTPPDWRTSSRVGRAPARPDQCPHC
jgi:hypothetical protein